jgi:soluble cytochrome b562
MSESIETARELATHAADIKHLQEDMDRLVADMDDIKKTLQAINSTLSEAKGGWKVLMMFGGAGGVLGAILTQVIHSVPWGK